MPNQALTDLQANYPHWVSFDTLTYCMFEDHPENPYAVGRGTIIIDDLPADPNIESIRFKLANLNALLQFNGRYYIFSETTIDPLQNANSISILDFLNTPSCHYLFSSNIIIQGTLSVESI